MNNDLKYVIALSLIPNVGPVTTKSLIAYCGGPEAIFRQKKPQLMKIPGIGPKTAEEISKFKDFDRVDSELEFIEKNKIKVFYYLNKDFPQRLKDISDSPVVLYGKGNINFNTARMLGVVGTRKATEYGKNLCEKLIDDLKTYNVTVVSGLAYGIDHTAHKQSVKNEIPTIGVLGSSLDQVYPASHKPLAEKMEENGGIISEYVSGTIPDAQNFPARNRIVAGLTDALVLVETALKGGALITAEISNSYNREVFAYPGRTNDKYSAGCNLYIKTNKAYLMESSEDLAYMMGWNEVKADKKDKKLMEYVGLSDIEKNIVGLIKEKEKLDIDSLCLNLKINPSELSLLVLDMEFKGILKALPGKFYRLQ